MRTTASTHMGYTPQQVQSMTVEQRLLALCPQLTQGTKPATPKEGTK